MAESWSTWQGELINGAFALRRLLGQSDHAAVFLTDYPARALPNAAIKIVAADPATADAQLSIWHKVNALSHPHLTRLLEAGRCQREGREYLYVITDYAEESLAEILPHRALNSEEVRAMLPPVLDALMFLHGNQLVQGQLKPSNVLVIDDQVKLASDTIHEPGAALPDVARTSVYDPPESASGLRSPAGDMWALGVTIVEALTQRAPSWTVERPQVPALPADFPRDFIDIVLRCLHPNPRQRPTPQELKGQLSGEITAPLAVLPESPEAPPAPPPRPAPAQIQHPAGALPVGAQPDRPAPVNSPPTSSTSLRPKPVRQGTPTVPKRSLTPFVVGAAVVVVLIWLGPRLFGRHHPQTPGSSGNAPLEAPAASPTPPTATAPTTPAQPAAPSAPELSPGVLHQELPTVARSANETIRGHLRVVVRVVVNRAGKVIDESLEDAGPSKYFARLASTASRNWQFTATDDHGTREWLLHYDFSKDQVTAKAEATPSPST